ncbi:uncharacterized protein ACJ7VT_011284 isoform 2-T2 [Polymixia lowei]
MMFSLVLLFILLTGHQVAGWDNNWDRVLHRTCPRNQVLSRISSYHSNSKEDRRWSISCKTLSNTRNCYWSGFVNWFDRGINFACRTNYVVAGVYSYHSNRHEDRRWQLYCCTAPRFVTFECQETPEVNYWDEYFNWYVPGANYMTGFRSHHSNKKEDRRWRFKYCRGKTDQSSRSSDIASQILNANSRMRYALTEGDIAVSRNRNARICNNCRWKKSSSVVNVPYTISSSFSSRHKSVIESAMNAFRMKTCVRFIRRSSQSDYISIVNKRGCWSYVGRTQKAQELSLQARGCVYTGIIQHELLHALGFWHEQSRSDRDRYVTINYQNIKPKQKHNFNKYSTNNLNTQYDYTSVMHYGKTAFSKNGRDTITPKTSAVIGQRVGMSELDILKINRLYSCSSYLPKAAVWDNKWDGVLNRMCPSGQAVSRITSVHSNGKEDRLWRFSCKAFAAPRTCRWSAYANSFDGYMNFRCPNNQVIAGAYSYHSNSKEDRRWKFYCCSAPRFTTFDCKVTPRMNYYDQSMNWPVPGGNFLTGVISRHDNRKEDRRWSFRYCQGRT